MNQRVYEKFCTEIAAERKRQDEKHGATCFEIPDSTDNPTARETYETIARNSCDRAFREGRLTNAHILDEEAAEALTAAAKGDVEGLKKELVQVASVCLVWLEAIEKRETPKRILKTGDRLRQVYKGHSCFGAIIEVGEFDELRGLWRARRVSGLVSSETWIADSLNFVDAPGVVCFERVPPEFRSGDKVRVNVTGREGEVVDTKGAVMVAFSDLTFRYYAPDQIERV